jgi:proton-dependent oligopeptide transporter, POT family
MPTQANVKTGLNQTGATALTNFFQFWCYITPILGAVCADQWMGKYKTIVLFSGFYCVGLLVLFLTSLPVAIEHGFALGGLVTAMVVIGLGETAITWQPVGTANSSKAREVSRAMYRH